MPLNYDILIKYLYIKTDSCATLTIPATGLTNHIRILHADRAQFSTPLLIRLIQLTDNKKWRQLNTKKRNVNLIETT